MGSMHRTLAYDGQELDSMTYGVLPAPMFL